MKKQFVFFTLILTILIQSTNGFSRNITFCPNPSITVNVDPGTCSAVVNSILPVTDISGGSMVLTTTLGNGDTFPVGTTTVTYQEHDATGIATGNICTFDVIVEDNEAPTPDAATLADVTAACEVTTLTPPTATDNCGGTVIITNDATLPVTTQGTILVTWTYDDGNGNTATQTQNIIIDDVTAPTPDAATLADVTAACEVTTLTSPTASDNCGGTVTVINDATLPITTQGTTVVTWTYDDGNGNTATQTQNIIIDDVTAPIPDVATLTDVTAACEVTILTPPTATDNCGGIITVTNDATLPITTQGTTVVTWTYDDGNGNTATQTQNIIIDDVTAPVADVATLADVIAECEVTILTPPTATDNCGGTVTVTNDATLPITTQGTTLVTWTYDDDNGNTSTQTQNIIIDDVTAPIPDAGTLTDVTAACEVTTLTPPTATDNCGGTVIVTNDASLPITTQGTTVVTWTYDDGNGNTATQTQNIIIDDVTAPIPDAGTLTDVTAACEVTTLTPPTATDNCGGTVIITNDASLPITTQGTTVVTWTYDDGNGNTSTQTQNIIIDDVTAPTPDAATLADVTAACEVTTLTPPTATDNCGGTVIITNDATLPITTQGTTVVTWTYDDGNGNTSTQTQNIIIDDVTAPIPDAATLADVTAACEVNSLTPPAATDNCGGTVIVTNDASFPITTQGTTLVTWTYDDGNGNTATQTQNIIIDDVTAPIPDVATLADVTAACEINNLTPPTATDNCGGTVIITNDASLPITTQGTTIVTWTYDDGNGNTSTQTQNIIIDDVTAPTFNSCPSNLSRNNDTGACGAIVNYTIPTATDSCGTAVVTQTDVTGLTSGSLFPIGTTTIEYTATDGHGNNTICSFSITVTDIELPTITCPTNITVDADANCEATTVNLGTPTTNDNCSVATVTNDLAGQLPLPVGTHTVTWTVTDTTGLTATCTQQVTVQDITPPVISCPTPNAFYNTDTGQCDATLSFAATTIDNCNGSPIISYEVAGTPITFPYAFAVGTTTVDVIADDGNGLTSTCSFNVVVEDHEAPVAICQPLTITLDATGNATIAEDAINNGSLDACGGLTFDTNQTNFDCTNIGVNNVILTVTDTNGNTTNCNTTVTVLDNVQSATASITASPISPICQGELVTFTASGSNLGTNPTYQWFEGGAAVGTNSDTYITTGLTNGESVYVEITSGPCNTVTISNSIVMTVNPLRPVSFTLNASANPSCTGENVTFFVTGLTNGGATPTYQWYEGATPVGTNTNSYTSSTITNGEIVSVEITSSETCADPIPAIESITMTVTPNATISLTSAAGTDNQEICNGSNITEIEYNLGYVTGAGATVTGLPIGFTTNYSGSSFTINGGSTVPVGTYNYIVTPIGCGNATATGTIIVNPDATITLISPDAYEGLCNGDPHSNSMTPIEFQLGPGATGAILNSTPALPAGLIGSYNAGTGIYTISGSTTQVGTYNYTVTTTGCGPGASIDGLISVFDGIPDEPSQMNNNSNIANVCDTPQTINLEVPLDPNVESYTWTFYDMDDNIINNNGFEIITDPNSNSIDVIVTAPQQWWFIFPVPYTVEITATNACGTSTALTGFIEILDLGTADIEVYTPDDGSGDTDIIYVCEGTPSVTMAGYVGGLDYDDWAWDDNGGVDGTSGSFSPTTFTETETVCVRYWPWWAGGGCRDYDTITTTITTETVDSEYTLPTNAQGGDIITISLIGDGGTLCNLAVDNLEIHILEATDAEITSTDITICEGESTTITFEGAPDSQIRVNDGSGNVWYNIQPDGTFPLTVSPIVTTTYTLNRGRYHPNTYPGSNNNNCPTVLNESVTITVNEPPTVTAPADVTICEGDTIDLSAATIGGTNYVGTWTTSGNGSFSGNTYTPDASDIFNSPITLTYTNIPSDGICPGVSDDMIVTINQAPTIYAGVDQTICNSDTVTMTASLGGSATSGIWSGGTGTFSSNDPNATYTPGVGETGTVVLTYTSNDPAGPCNSAADTVEITIDQGVTVDAGTDQTICEGDTVTLTATFGGSATSATWNTSGSGTFSGNIYTPSVADITNGNVTLTYTTNNPTGICNPASDSILVTINPQPTVDVGINQSVCSTSTSITMNAVLGGGASSATWSTSGDGGFDNNNTNAVYTFGTNDIANGTVTLTYTTNDPTGPCIAASDSFVVNIIPYIAANPSYTYVTNNGDCSDTVLNLSADGTGYWSAVSVPAGSPFTFSDTTNPNATFTGESGTEYNLTWNVDNAAPCADDNATINVVFPNCGVQIDFDGTDDSVNFANSYNLPGNFSIEAWIKPNAINGGIQTILSKRNANNFATGYDLRLVNNTISFHANGSSISANGITSNRWYHIAVTYNGTIYTLYIDGIQRNSSAGPAPATNNFNMLLGAMSRLNNVPTNYYNGWMDEIRLWNTDLNVTQIRQMMNQEIENNGGQVRGVEVPLNITGLTWSNLTAYYQMNQSTHISGGNLIANVGTSGTIRNITTLQAETAPLPYVTAANGNWNTPATWLNNDVQLLPNSTGINWNIVRTQHNVHSGNRATTVLGLLVDANTFTIDNDQSLTVDHYLNIDGVLDLEGESQLLQPSGSIVDYSGLGNLHRDQQGTTNMFNYNYWSSPVSTNGNTFQINALHDGVNPVNWTSGNNATGSTNPVTISNRWLYLYENYTAGNYADWHAINQNYSVPVGLGFTMKGSGVGDPVSDIQNYTFVGQPNNGTITTPVTGGNEALIGNPYPSAINANQFILDNAGSITGPLYFWEHSLTNSSHITIDYEGGYATYSLAGGVAATTPPAGLTGIGVVGKVPRQYIAVGQGFYVTGDADGGTITFNNNQRTFVKETLGASVFLRTENHQEPTDIIKRVRLNFTSPEGAVRPLLLAFTPNNEASDAIDYGFDAKNSDYFPSDMSFLIENEKYIIQGVGAFDIEKMYPVAIDLGVSGNIQIALDDLENFEEAIDVFIYDALLGSYTAINENNYQITLDAGSHNNRYFIAFKEDNELNTIDQQHINVVINYLSATSEIYINVPNTVDIKQVYLVNLLGQTVKSWNTTNAPLSQECKLPVRKIAEGTYIIKVRTSNNAVINKKVVVKQ